MNFDRVMSLESATTGSCLFLSKVNDCSKMLRKHGIFKKNGRREGKIYNNNVLQKQYMTFGSIYVYVSTIEL